MGQLHQTKPIVSGAKMTTFLLGATLAIIMTFGMFTRPAQAVFLSPVTAEPSTVDGCSLNIGVCPPPNDATMPAVALGLDLLLIGGNTHTVTITGSVSDDHLASYVLALGGDVIQQGSDPKDKVVNIDNVLWNVAVPIKIPSGSYVVTLDATDKAGNTTHTEKTVVVDNDGPAVYMAGGDTIIKSGSISPITTADDPQGVASYAWTADADNPALLNFDASVSEPAFAPTVNGLYTFYADVADGLGNITHGQFSFTDAQELAIVPLPIIQDPTIALIHQAPSTPYVLPSTIRPTLQAGKDMIAPSNDSEVLGSSVIAADQTPATKTIASIAPTTSGWSIFGFLWYWWLAVAGILYIAWLLVKKMVLSRIPKQY